MPNIGPLELIIILAIVVVLFGATRIGDIGKGLGRGIKEFRRELRDGQEEEADAKKPDSTTVASKTTDDTPAKTH
jgi:sec-independent protein translocase protein TatA